MKRITPFSIAPVPVLTAAWLMLLLALGPVASGRATTVEPRDPADHAVAGNEEDHDDHADGDDHADHEDIVRLTAAQQEEFGISLATAGPGTLRAVRILPAEVQPNGDRVAHLTPRYAGIATDVRVQVGDTVRAGQVLAIVESDETLAEYPLTASLDGVVIARHMTPGEPVGREHTVVVVADLRTVWIDIAVYQRDLGLVRRGAAVTVRADAEDLSADGIVGYVAPVVDPHTRTSTARVVLDNPDGRWRPGMFVTAQADHGSTHSELVLPRSAIQYMEGETAVFVQNGDEYELRPITTGRESTDAVEILSGLSTGEVVVTRNGFALKAEMNRGALEHAGHAH